MIGTRGTSFRVGRFAQIVPGGITYIWLLFVVDDDDVVDRLRSLLTLNSSSKEMFGDGWGEDIGSNELVLLSGLDIFSGISDQMIGENKYK